MDINLDDAGEEGDHYLADLKRLFRLQSILANGLNVRSGTFGRDTMIDVVKTIVKSAGRFARTNLFMASQFLAEPEEHIENIKIEFKNEINEAIDQGKDEEEFVMADYLEIRIMFIMSNIG